MMLVWALAATEVVSALSRKRREQKLDARADRTAQRRLNTSPLCSPASFTAC